MKAVVWVLGTLIGWFALGLVSRVLAETFLLGWRLI